MALGGVGVEARQKLEDVGERGAGLGGAGMELEYLEYLEYLEWFGWSSGGGMGLEWGWGGVQPPVSDFDTLETKTLKIIPGVEPLAVFDEIGLSSSL